MAQQQAARRRRKRAVFILCLLAVLFLLGLLATKMLRGVPEQEYSSIEEHFKYGSIGTDTLRQGLPYWIWKVLPIMFEKGPLPQNGKPGYEAFGLIVERDQDGHLLQDRPVGFSKRRIGYGSLGMAVVGLNCAFCHASTVRTSEKPGDQPKIILGMPGHTVDVEEFFVFLFKTARHEKFTGNEVMKAIERQRQVELQDGYAPMGFVKGSVYRWIIIPLYRWEIGKLEKKLCFIKKLGAKECGSTRLATDAGPGRLDLFSTYKVLRFTTWFSLYDLLPDLTPATFDSIDLDIGDKPGFADTAPLWQLEKRVGRGFHWDGNTLLLHDYTIIAALGLNVMPRSLDVPAFNRIARWAKTRRPPQCDEITPAPCKVNLDLSKKGKRLYFQHCASCHDPGGQRFGLVEPVELIGTDRNRFDAFTEELADKLKGIGTGYDWRLRHFEKTTGYSNLPLDGIWLRAPYLHNGSIPTLRDLLNGEETRPKAFCRGYDVYDWKKIGFADLPRADCEKSGFFWYDTTKNGNGNKGHLQGTTTLSNAEKDALVEYLKTL